MNKYSDQHICDMVQWIRKHGTRCKHSHTILSHPNCQPEIIKDRLAFIDTEFFGRDADWGQLLCWVIMDEAGKMWWDVRKGKNDKSVVKKCFDKLKDFDVIVHHYGRRCDWPYLLTRALINDLEIPPRSALRQIDLWRICRDRLSLGRNSQAALSQALRKESFNGGVDAYAWSKATFGNDKKALDQILNHCKIDTQELRLNYYGLKSQIGKATP